MGFARTLVLLLIGGCGTPEVPDIGECSGARGVLDTVPGVSSCEDSASRSRSCREANLPDTYAVEVGCERPTRRVDETGECTYRVRGTEGCTPVDGTLCCPQY